MHKIRYGKILNFAVDGVAKRHLDFLQEHSGYYYILTSHQNKLVLNVFENS